MSPVRLMREVPKSINPRRGNSKPRLHRLFVLGARIGVLASVLSALSCGKAARPASDAPTKAEAIQQKVSLVDRHGLIGEYFNAKNLTDPRLTRLDPNVDVDWDGKSPSSSDYVGTDTFSVRWTGFVEPLFSESYTFVTQADDGVRLWVNGKQLIEDWTNHSLATREGTISLQAGQKVPIILEYFENGDVHDAIVRFVSL